jgi:hypothetical protein
MRKGNLRRASTLIAREIFEPVGGQVLIHGGAPVTEVE